MSARWRLLTPLVVIVVLACLPAVASAAPPTPVSTTGCGGPVTIDPSPTTDDPYLLDYKFHCNEDITAYTLIVNRRTQDDGTVNDFDPNPSLIQPDGTASATQSVTCSGDTPGNGINCNAGAAGINSAWSNITGSVDLVEPYCKHIPAGSKPGTVAIPQAVVQVVVTNTTGAQNGPFRLDPGAACPKVPDFVPFPKVTTPKPKPKPKHKPKKTKKVKTHKATHHARRRS